MKPENILGLILVTIVVLFFILTMNQHIDVNLVGGIDSVPEFWAGLKIM